MTRLQHSVNDPNPRDVNISDDPLSASAAEAASALFQSQPKDLGPLSPSAAATPPPQAPNTIQYNAPEPSSSMMGGMSYGDLLAPPPSYADSVMVGQCSLTPG
jgi:hypothetical protein